MEPRPLLRPVGPEPARVYWLRRTAVLAGVAIAVAAAAYACSAGGGGAKPRTQQSPASHPTTSTAAPPAAARCGHGDLTVEASTDQSVYPAGVLPRLSAVVRNVAGRDCRFLTSPATRAWTILSGTDQVWASGDCTPAGVVARTRLRAGRTIAYGLVWDRHRSATGCPSALAAAQPGTYRLFVSVNGVRSTPVIFHLTG